MCDPAMVGWFLLSTKCYESIINDYLINHYIKIGNYSIINANDSPSWYASSEDNQYKSNNHVSN